MLGKQQGLFGTFAGLTFLRFAESSLQGRDQVRKVALENVVRSAADQTAYRGLFADRAGNQNEGNIRTMLPRKRERRTAIVGGQLVVRENQVKVARAHFPLEGLALIDPSDLTIHPARLQAAGHQLGILGVIFEMKNAQSVCHGPFGPRVEPEASD